MLAIGLMSVRKGGEVGGGGAWRRRVREGERKGKGKAEQNADESL